MSITCKFHLTRSSNVYNCGERIEGSVTLYPLRLRPVEAIYLQFYGQTQVAWFDLDKTTADNNIEHNDFSTQEVSQKTLFGNQQKHVCDQLKLVNWQLLQPRCEYRYEFSFLTPQQLPATSRCPLGECEYGLQLVLQRTKKVNKEFHQRIIIKRKLDLSKSIACTEPRSIEHHNDFGKLVLSTPCTGFTPGQKVPYHLYCQTARISSNKVLVQLNCLMRCRSSTPRNNVKFIKQILNLRKHSGMRKISAYLSLPLDSQITMTEAKGVEELIMSYEYTLEALVIDDNKKIQLSVALPLIIGTTPCLISSRSDSLDGHLMCYDNYGSSHGESIANTLELAPKNLPSPLSQQLSESMDLLPVKRKTAHLRRSLRYCYKKISKFI